MDEKVELRFTAKNEAAAVFGQVKNQIKDIHAEAKKAGGVAGLFGGAGGGIGSLTKWAGGLFAAEKVTGMLRGLGDGLKDFSEGKITGKQALAKAMDPLPILG